MFSIGLILEIDFHHYQFTCVFTYIAILLTILYTLLLLRCSIYLYRLFARHPRNKRRPQKVFLLCATICCIGRVLYFLLYPATVQDSHANCTPTNDSDDPTALWLSILGTLPPCFFLTSFSVNVFTFGRIYHTVLSTQRNQFQALLASLITINLAVYSLTILAYFGANDNSGTAFLASVWCLSIGAFLVAIGFAYYGIMLYYKMKHIQMNESDSIDPRTWTWNSTERLNRSIRANQSQRSHPEFDSITVVNTNTTSIPNPMHKLAVVSIVCLGCFLIRAILLPVLTVLFNGAFEWSILLLYFVFSEIVPLCLMLVIFDPSPSPPPVVEQPSLDRDSFPHERERFHEPATPSANQRTIESPAHSHSHSHSHAHPHAHAHAPMLTPLLNSHLSTPRDTRRSLSYSDAFRQDLKNVFRSD